jgi:hypothetical protein
MNGEEEGKDGSPAARRAAVTKGVAIVGGARYHTARRKRLALRQASAFSAVLSTPCTAR